MDRLEQQNQHVERLREWRNFPEKDYSLGFMTEQFKREVKKPQKALDKLYEVWQELIPAHLQPRTQPMSLKRGVLTVHVSDSATLYEMQRLVRSGLQDQLALCCGATLNRVKLVVAKLEESA